MLFLTSGQRYNFAIKNANIAVKYQTTKMISDAKYRLKAHLKGSKSHEKEKMLLFCFFILRITITFAPAKLSKTLKLTQ
jgi:hypothetical protein